MSYTTEKDGDWKTYRGAKDSGYIIINQGAALAFESPLSGLTRLTQGLHDEGLIKFLKKDADTLVHAIYICYLRRTEAPELRPMIKVSGPPFDNDQDQRNFIDAALDLNFYEKMVEQWLLMLFNELGGKGLSLAAAVVELIENKSKFVTAEERQFLKCIEWAAEHARAVPTQKAVFELWHDPALRPDAELFKGMRDRLGFSWLPAE